MEKLLRPYTQKTCNIYIQYTPQTQNSHGHRNFYVLSCVLCVLKIVFNALLDMLVYKINNQSTLNCSSGGNVDWLIVSHRRSECRTIVWSSSMEPMHAKSTGATTVLAQIYTQIVLPCYEWSRTYKHKCGVVYWVGVWAYFATNVKGVYIVEHTTQLKYVGRT